MFQSQYAISPSPMRQIVQDERDARFPEAVGLNAGWQSRLLNAVEAPMAWIEPANSSGPGTGTWIQPVIVAGMAQQLLAWIHLHLDGNRWMERMFTTAVLYQRRYDFKYLFGLSSRCNWDRSPSDAALLLAGQSGDYATWRQYFAGRLRYPLRVAIDQAKGVVVQAGCMESAFRKRSTDLED